MPLNIVVRGYDFHNFVISVCSLNIVESTDTMEEYFDVATHVGYFNNRLCPMLGCFHSTHRNAELYGRYYEL